MRKSKSKLSLEEMQQRKSAGQTYQQIADEAGIKKASVFRKLNPKIKIPKARKRKYDEKIIHQISNLYLKMETKENICKKFNLSSTQLIGILARYSIVRPKDKKGYYLSLNPTLNESLRKLREKGLNYKEIGNQVGLTKQAVWLRLNRKKQGAINKMANESITINEQLATKLKAQNLNNSMRGNAITIFERYFDIIKVGRREVRKTFSDSELNLLCDICNGTMFEPFGMILENNGILMQYQDTIDIYGEQFNEKWQVSDLSEKIKNLSKLGQIGLIDVVESFWANQPDSIADV